MLWKADYPYYRYVLIFLYFFFVSCPHMRRLWAGAGVMRRKYLAGNCRSVVPPWILWRRSRERLHSTSRSPTVLDIGDPERRRFKRFGWSEKRADIQTGRRQYNGGKNDTDGRGSGCKRRPPGHAAWSRAIFRQPWVCAEPAWPRSFSLCLYLLSASGRNSPAELFNWNFVYQ